MSSQRNYKLLEAFPGSSNVSPALYRTEPTLIELEGEDMERVCEQGERLTLTEHLVGAKLCVKRFTCVISLNLYTSNDRCYCYIIVHVRKLRLREVKNLVKDSHVVRHLSESSAV